MFADRLKSQSRGCFAQNTVWPNGGKVLLVVGSEQAGHASTQNNMLNAQYFAAKCIIVNRICFQFDCSCKQHASFNWFTVKNETVSRRQIVQHRALTAV
jgi:hypothetical protein